jgi:vacuolar protein 8
MLLDHLDVEIRNTCIFTVANFCSNTNNHPYVLKENCVPKLVYFLTTADKNAQLRSVAALRGLSTDADIRLDIIDAGALDPLLKLAKSDDVEVQLETLACLCNLSLCGCIGDSPLSFLGMIYT